MAVVFKLVSFDDGRQWTGLAGKRGERMFGPIAMTYAAEPDPVFGTAASRIVGRLACAGDTRGRRAKAYALAWGDLVMMRKQFLNLKELAERSADGR